MTTPTPNPVPKPKVVAATLAAAITSVIVWILSAYAGVEIPPEVAAAITTLIAFGAGYLTSES